MRVGAIALVMLACVALAADPAKNDSNTDKEQMQGVWTGLSAEKDGHALPAAQVSQLRLEIDDNHYVVRGRGNQPEEGTFTLDATVSPKALDVKPMNGPDKGQVLHGIYKIEGDEHTSCFAPAGKDRPKQFDSKNGNELYTMKRAFTDLPKKRTLRKDG
jgi:uncharacterized protein (TIGR03067 family)